MTKKQRNLLDDILEQARRFVEDLENMLNPDQEREPARVPVPVEPERYPPRRNSYDQG